MSLVGPRHLDFFKLSRWFACAASGENYCSALILCPRKATLPGSARWFRHLLSNRGSNRIHYSDSSLLFTYHWGSNLLSLWIFLWLQTEEQPLALDHCEKHSLIRNGISSFALRFLMGRFYWPFLVPPRQVKNVAAPRWSQLFCYLSDGSPELTVSLKK